MSLDDLYNTWFAQKFKNLNLKFQKIAICCNMLSNYFAVLTTALSIFVVEKWATPQNVTNYLGCKNIAKTLEDLHCKMAIFDDFAPKKAYF